MRKPSAATVVAMVALFVALGGPATAARLISGSQIRNNSITSAKIRTHTLKQTDLSPSLFSRLLRVPVNSVAGPQVIDHTLTGNDVTPGSLGSAELANASVLTAKIRTSAVSNSRLSPNAVTGSKVKDGTLTGADVGRLSGTATIDFPAVPAGACASQTVKGSAYTAVAGTLVVVGAPAALADGLLVSGRPAATNDGLVVQLCNLTAAPENPPSLGFPFIAFTP